MKKFLSILLALTMVLSLGTVAFADNSATITSVTESNTASFDVTGTVTVNEGAYADVVYSVKVEWTVDPLALEVNKAQPYTWNPATLRYEAGTADSDTIAAKDVEVSITLTNSSNAAVNYTVAYADNGSDAWTTTEATKTGDKTGKLDNADAIDGLATDYTDDSHAYAIDITKQGDEGTGTAQVKTYTGTVTLPAINDTKAMTTGNITLGTYTVTLSKYEEPAAPETKTVSEILALSASPFPTTYDNGWKNDKNDNDHLYIAYGELSSNASGESLGLNEIFTKNAAGNYELVIPVNESEADETITGTVTYTFVMTDNVLTGYKHDIETITTKKHGETTPFEDHISFTAPTT